MRAKLAALVLLVGLLFCGAGCMSIAGIKKQVALINEILDATYPQGFNGTLHLDDKNPYFQFTLDATGVRRDPNGWHWDTINFHYDGRFSSGNFVRGLTPKPANPVP